MKILSRSKNDLWANGGVFSEAFMNGVYTCRLCVQHADLVLLYRLLAH